MFRFPLCLLLSMGIAGCASRTGAIPRPFPLPGATGAAGATGSVPGATGSVPGATGATGAPGATSADGYSISSTALSLRGTPYRNGGTDPSGFDCSGFVHYVYSQHGVRIPRDVRQQYGAGNDIDPRQLEPGDLVFFSTVAPGASHVGIAVGGDQFVHAPSSTGVVRVEHLSSQYWANRFVGAKRVN